VNLVGQNLELDDRKILIYSKKLLKICKWGCGLGWLTPVRCVIIWKFNTVGQRCPTFFERWHTLRASHDQNRSCGSWHSQKIWQHTSVQLVIILYCNKHMVLWIIIVIFWDGDQLLLGWCLHVFIFQEHLLAASFSITP
jgi:hypothetical protein